MPQSRFQHVGRDVPRVDGFDKVTGRAKYTGDIVLHGMLEGRILRSPLPHARVRAVDTSKAEALDGVRAVVTAGDLAGLDPFYNGRPVVALEKVRYVGEPVAAVAAEDEHTAEAALALIDVDYEELPSALGMDAALAPGAPLIHDDAPGNVCAHERVEQGDVEEGFAASDRVFEGRYTFPMVYHYSMEPHAAVARYGADGIDLWSSAQHPFLVEGDIARIFGMTRSQVRLRVPYLGGGFGGKSYTKFEPLVVVLSRKAGRPVRLCLSVPEAMVTVRRHGAVVELRTGVKNDGTLVARQAEIRLDTGAFTENTRMVAQLAATRVLGPYRIPHLRSDVYSVHTNAGSAGSFRSVAAPQTIFACESQMDEIAAELGMDPVELRDRNLLKRGETLQPRLRPVDVNLRSSLRRLVAGARWHRRAGRGNDAGKGRVKGAGTGSGTETGGREPGGPPLGMACGSTNAGGVLPVSVALVRLGPDGYVAVMAGSTEMGQGVRTTFTQIVAEELALPLDRVRAVSVDTTVTPYDHSTGASRSTTVMGRAVQAAARDLKRQLRAIAAKAFGVTTGKVSLSQGQLVAGEQAMSFTDALERRFGAVAGEIVGRGTMDPNMVRWQTPVLWEVGMGVAELDIDRDTGALNLVSYVSVADVGKAIHPQHCIGQEEGAAMMGIGHTFMEQMVHDDHQLLNPNLVDYRVPKFEDLPAEFHTLLVENRDGIGPYGSRGMGEGGIFSVAPSVVSALARATGVRIRDLPLTPERVWRALREEG
ncbi:MAG: xanthine dehydrogenase family protein molybdopterin-binding subunit [Deltaproteobacteria bacterium]|nr:xanthine dehydrogenase family protein molybdopterin-binding subunit [Deltaproteobacteria bacterium]